jgi:tetratricopeptide (TPR) repeat protein
MNMPEELQLAQQHHHAGRLADAERSYRQILARDPNHADALYGLGTLALQVGQNDLAEQMIRRAIELKGEWPEACYHLAVAQQAQEKFDEAIAGHRRAVALKPSLFDAHYNLAVCLQVTGQRDKAIAAYEQAIALKSDDAYALVNFAIALQSAGRLDEAIGALRKAVVIKPDLAEAFTHLGTACRARDLVEESIQAFTRARDLSSDDAKSHANLAAALRDAGRIDDAIASLRAAIELNPDDPEAHVSLANLLLLTGDFPNGFAELQRRHKRKKPHFPRRNFSQQIWDGTDLSGRTIFLYAEGTIADTIQLLRFVPLVQQRGGKVLLEVQPSLRRLIPNDWPVHDPGRPPPDFDVHCSLLDLPCILGITPKTIPAKTPYLRVPAELSRAWREKISSVGGPLKVGLAWSGSPSEPENHRRSVPFSELSSLFEISNLQFFSLQKHSPAHESLIDFTDDLNDFADTAALIDQLDLVISIDIAVAHLAGAMGKPVWTLLPFVPHWKWSLTGNQTPWYPSMRLFRQTSRNDWTPVIARVAAELRDLAPAIHPPIKSRANPKRAIADTPLIQFHAIEKDWLPAPYPALNAIPNWFKSMAAEVQLPDVRGVLRTAKQCPPFLDAITAGYIIPLPGDVNFSLDAAGQLTFDCPNGDASIETHHPAQIAGSPWENTTVIKFLNPWVIITPPGYSTLFLPPMNQDPIPFQILAGIVDTDNFYAQINFPAACRMTRGSTCHLKRGTPLVQLIPFKRDAWHSQTTHADATALADFARAIAQSHHVYREQSHRKKTFD